MTVITGNGRDLAILLKYNRGVSTDSSFRSSTAFFFGSPFAVLPDSISNLFKICRFFLLMCQNIWCNYYIRNWSCSPHGDKGMMMMMMMIPYEKNTEKCLE